MSVNRMMNQSKGAMSVTQKALATTSHNISNVNTKGYSRQRVDLETNPSSGLGKIRVGTGVKIAAVTRAGSEFVNKRIGEENSELGKYETLSEVYHQLESDLGNESDSGITNRISRFFNDLRSLSTEPSSSPLRAAVRESANAVVSRFHGMRENIGEMTADINRRVEGSINDINSITKKISDLNKRIVDIEIVQGSFANDERDSRDLALKELSKLIPVDVIELENGGINVSSGKIGTLVDPSNNYEIRAARESDEYSRTTIKVYTQEFGGGQGKDVTASLSGGVLGGLIKARDTMIPKVVDRMDTLAFGFAKSLNNVHRQGYGTNGQTNLNLFDLGAGMGVRGAAERISLSDSVTKNLSNLATSQTLGAKGDNNNVLDLADLEDATIFENGSANFQTYMSGLVGSIGVEARSINDSLDTQSQVLGQLEQLREEASGVSLDEEAIDMMKFQKAFDANAKMIQIADSMMETVLNLKRF